MKNNTKISIFAIVCAACATVSGADAASSVRSLGGAGTYSSASAASNAASTGAARAGSLRVTPTAGKTGTVASTTPAASTTTGRVATTPRLSIGKYLGGTTSVSGGSSTRPDPGDGGTTDPSVVADLRRQVEQLQRDAEELRQADDNLSDQLGDKQDTLVPRGDGFIEIDGTTNEIYVDVDGLKDQIGSIAGQDGREVEIGSSDESLLWRYAGEGDDKWQILISKAEITGPQGERGPAGEPGTPADLSLYSTTEQMNTAIANAINALSAIYAAKTDVYTKEQVNTALTGKQNKLTAGANITIDGDTISATPYDDAAITAAIAAKADKATSLAGYGIDDAYTKEQVDAKIRDSGTFDADQYYTKTETNNALADKQNKLTAGAHITIDDDTISAESYDDTAVRALINTNATNITANKNAIDANTANITTNTTNITANTAAISANTTAIEANTTAISNKADKATTLAGYNIGDAYTKAEVDAKITQSGTFDADQYYTKTETNTALAGKQDKLTAGTNITIDGNTISATGGMTAPQAVGNYIFAADGNGGGTWSEIIIVEPE